MQNKEQNLEPILQENADRFVLFPIEHDDIWQFYKKAEASFWTAVELIERVFKSEKTKDCTRS